MTDPARLRPLDRLRLLKVLDENPELQDALSAYRDINQLAALEHADAGVREVARQRYLAIGDFRDYLAARKDGYLLEMEREDAELRAKEAAR